MDVLERTFPDVVERLTGIFHLLWALVILAMGGIIVGEFVMSEINEHSTAIWCSFIFATTGILSTIIYCLPRNKALIITHNVFAILSIFFAVAVIVAGAVGTEHYDCKELYRYTSHYDPYNNNYNNYYYYILWYPYECNNESDRHIAQPIYICLIVFGVFEIVCGIISTIYSFRLYNCCRQGRGNCCKECCDGCCKECKQTGYQSHSQAYQMQHAPVYQQQQITHQQQIPQQQQQVQQPQIVTDANGQQYYLMHMQPMKPIQPMQPMQPQVAFTTTGPEISQQNPPSYSNVVS